MLIGAALPWLKEHGFEREVDPPMTLPPYYYNKTEDTFILVSEISKANEVEGLSKKVGKMSELMRKFDGYQKNLSYGK